MRMRWMIPICLAGALTLSACGTDDGTKPDAGGTADVNGGDSGSGTDGQDGSSVDSTGGDATETDGVESDGTSGDSTDGDTTIVGEPGPSAGGFVSGGGVMSSPKFTLLSTIGVPDQSILTSTSTTYRLQGGLIGSIGVTP